MGRTKFDRLDMGVGDVAVFRMSGTLGFHENAKIKKLVDECLKRNFRKVLFDFIGLSSLGGGVARILREFVETFNERGGEVGFIVTSSVVLDFLQDGHTSFHTYGSLEEALSGELPKSTQAAVDGEGTSVDRDEPSGDSRIPPWTADGEAEGGGSPRAGPKEAAPVAETADGTQSPDQEIILMTYDGEKTSEEGASTVPPRFPEGGSGGSQRTGDPDVEAFRAMKGGKAGSEIVFTEIFGDDHAENPPAWIDAPSSPFDESGTREKKEDERVTGLNRKLKRRILELKTLFSIGKDFSSIRDRKKLLDIFLLTSIAQGGVESAVLFERHGEAFVPVMSKGLDLKLLESLSISVTEKMDESGLDIVVPLDDFDIRAEEQDALKQAGLEHICTFRQEGQLIGLVLLGKRIAGRGMKREDFEFLRILVTLAQGACENAVLFEREHERTLGIVKSLISLIEENTLLKGTSEFVSRYVGAVAKDMGYAEEHFKDLIYGTVLRDMGMIKVSDLILRSPRDLSKEEWEIVKKHPEDGAAMLERMKFSNRVVQIVKSHHERFNGEGYPMGLVGKEIPQGARIISVVESYAAMIHARPNRPALSEREALDTLKENYGLRYDREVVNHFVNIMEKEIAKSVRPVAPVG